MAQDILCVVSGVRPGGGPEHFAPRRRTEELLAYLATQISQLTTTGITYDDAKTILESVPHFLTQSEEEPDNDFEITRGSGSWRYFNTCIAIGCFDANGETHVVRDPEGGGVIGIPPGRFVEVRVVCDETAGRFIRAVVDPDEPNSEAFYDGVTRVQWRATNCCPVGGNPSLFVLEGPFWYLEAWVDRDALPDRRTAFPDDPDLPFAAELYEILNTRAQPRSEYKLDMYLSGTEKLIAYPCATPSRRI